MEWTLRLVETGIDGQSRSFEVITINRPDGLGDIANLGLCLGSPLVTLPATPAGVSGDASWADDQWAGAVIRERGPRGRRGPLTL
jgi:hypothetical protein